MAIIGIDFDGTCVTHEYPEIGSDIGAIPVLKKLVENGHKLILLTMRSGDLLEEAVNWFSQNGIELYDVNKNKSQRYWTSSPKVYANFYIDDTGIGIPLLFDGSRNYVDWKRTEILLRETYNLI